MHPIVVRFGPVTVYSYGALLSVAFLVGAVIAAREGERKGVGGQWMYDFLLVTLVSGVVVSRLLFVLMNLGLYVSNPWTVLNVAEGGLSLHGALLGGLLAALWFARRKKVSFDALADTVSPSLALGIGIGRWGCFFNGCCYGTLTSLPWATMTRYAPGLRHPTQIYESFLALLMFWWLWRARTRVKADGQLFMLFLALYSVIRFFVEFYRESPFIGPLTYAQVASLAIAAFAVVRYYVLGRRAGGRAWADSGARHESVFAAGSKCGHEEDAGSQAQEGARDQGSGV